MIVREFEMEEDLHEKAEIKEEYKNIIEKTKIVDEVEETRYIDKVAVFPEEKRDYALKF